MVASRSRRRRQAESPSEPTSPGLESGSRSGHKRRRAEVDAVEGKEVRRTSKRIRVGLTAYAEDQAVPWNITSTPSWHSQGSLGKGLCHELDAAGTRSCNI